MNVDMDSIVISIESTTEKASNAIDTLISKLNELQTALSNVGKASNGFRNISKNISSTPKNIRTPKTATNTGSVEEQLDKLKVNLKDYDVASVFKSESTRGITSEITKYKNAMGDVVTVQKKMRDGMDDYYRVTKKTTNEGISGFEKFRNSIVGTIGKITTLALGAKNLLNHIMELTETSAEYTEAVNLFYTEMGDKAEDAEKWVKRFSEALYLDPADVMAYMGAFNSLVSGLGVGAENSYKMSKNLTQLAYDLASYKNISFESAYDKLSSGIAGQIKGLRSVGVALSQNTLQELANELGIKQRITTLDEASKAQLRYIQIMRSSTNWQADLGKTLMSTENILKSARQQWTLMTRALGNVAAVVVRQLMPYFIALTQLIQEAAVSLASFFGLDISFADAFKDGSKNAGVSIGSLKDGIKDIGTGADKTKKKINTMLAPFDDLNVVQTKVEKTGVSGGDSALGSLGDLPLPEYDALSKLTGEWSNKIAEAKERLQSLLKVAKVVGTVFLTIWGLNKVSKFASAIQNILGLFGFFGGKKIASAGSGATNILPTWKTLLKGMAEIAVLIGGAALFVTALGKLTQIPGFKKALTDGLDGLQKLFLGLAKIALPLAGFSAGIAILGGTTSIKSMAIGLADLAIVVGGLEGLVLAIGGIMNIPGFKVALSDGLDSIETVFTRLSKMALPLAGFTAALALMGLTGGAGAVAIAIGLAMFAEVIIGLQAVVAAVGALSQIKGFDWLVTKGGESLIKIGTILGEFAGSIVSSALSKISSSLPKIGTDLAVFATNATPFFDNIKKVDEGSTRAMKNLAQMILLLTAQNIIDGLTSWFTGGTSLTKFGEDLASFGPNFNSFAKSVQDIDSKKVEGATNAAKAVGAMAKELPNEGGVVGWFAGENNLKKFGEMLPSFGKNLKTYADNVKGLDSAVVTNSSNAAKSVSAMAKELPNQGGMVAWFTGDNTLKKFGEMLPSFGKDFKDYANNVKGIDPNVVTNSANAAKSISSFANNLPNQGGIKSWFSGDNKLSTFGKELKSFGGYFKEYYDKIKNITIDKVNGVTSGIGILLYYLETIKDEGLGSVLTSFGTSMKTAATDIKSYFTTSLSSKNVGTLGFDFGAAIGKNIKQGMKEKLGTTLQVTDNTGKQVSTLSIKAYKGGGYPDKASLFWANENGIPEMVGQIGNKTAVANNDQITTSITNALITALSGMNFGGQGTTVVNIGNKKVYEGMGEYLDGESERYGTTYVNI